MPHMFVTLDVSKLSGWLNAFADCRESKGGRMRVGSRGAGRKAEGVDSGGGSGALGEGPTGAWDGGRAHAERARTENM